MTFVNRATDVTPTRWAQWGSAEIRPLRHDANGAFAAQIELPPHWSGVFPSIRDTSLEIFVLTGAIRANTRWIEQWGYLRLPAVVPGTLSVVDGATLLVFGDTPQAADNNELQIVKTTHADWHKGVVAARDTGRSLDLEVRDLYSVAETGRRTWLLRAGPGLALPYERHRTIEEGYIVSGKYRLIERLADGEIQFDHEPGGYFWRPPGIVHGGPKSGSDGEFVMLLRTPEALTVEFVD